MRYQNWDVLIFPEKSKVPLQEFKTQCLVTRDYENLQNPQFNAANFSPYYSHDGKQLSFLPVVTSFIGSLAQGDDFRISIHSWERPRASKSLENLTQLDDMVMFEVRVYLDGILKTRSLFDHRTMWPFVIDSADSERTSEPEPLRFPVFHSEILKQNHWDAGESYGRIKIIIAEGLCCDMRAADTEPPGFVRFRDVVGFAFQHAPLNILEFSGIAWPNEVMWKQAEKLATQTGQNSQKPTIAPDHDAHAHSPRRTSLSDHANVPVYCYNNPRECAYRGCAHPRHFASPQHQMPGRPLTASMYSDNTVAATYLHNTGVRNVPGSADDPFLVTSHTNGNAKSFQRKQVQSSSHDVSMPDFGSRESRPATEMSGVTYNRANFERQVNDAAIDEIVKALSPTKQEELLKALNLRARASEVGTFRLRIVPQISLLRSGMAARGKLPSTYADFDSNDSNSDRSPCTSRTTSNEERLISLHRAKFGSASPAENVQSKKERDQARKSIEQVTSEPGITVESSGSKSRSPLIEALNINRQRSDSAGSKRKRSGSKLDQVTSAEQSPTSGTRVTDLGAGIFSPYNLIDDDDIAGGSRRRTAPST